MKSRLELFLDKLGTRDSKDCIPWVARINDAGYGMFYDGTRMVRAHRWSFEHFAGPIPDGLDIDHLCRNRACVNPEHLEPVTRRVNVLRGISTAALRANQTHCHRGHEFNEKNTYRNPSGWRQCRACGASNSLRYYYAKRAAA